MQINRLFFLFTVLSAVLFACKETPAPADTTFKEEIKQTMAMQEEAWSSADMESYMQAYWNSDSLKFLSNNTLTYGWQNQLESYKRAYPDKEAMGRLSFEIKQIDQLDKNSVLVIGTYTVTRSDQKKLFGYYSLIWKKIKRKWVIVFDHTN